MILGKPYNLSDFICVFSDEMKILHEMGFIPMYREIGKDKYYFVKTNEICKVVEKWNLIIK